MSACARFVATRLLLAVLLLTLCSTFPAVVAAQGLGGSSGDIRGLITDQAGVPVANAKVTAVATQTGASVNAVSDGRGQYQLAGLAVGAYAVKVEVSAKQRLEQEVIVTVGKTAVADFRLGVSGLTAVIVAPAPGVPDAAKQDQAAVINQQQLQELPTNRRDYLELSRLTPAVADTNQVTGDLNLRAAVPQPASGLSFNGDNGRSNALTIDGGEASTRSGDLRRTLSQEAVEEFRIHRNSYPAEFGEAGSAVIHVVTKTGSNQVHGSLYGLFSKDALNSSNPFAYTGALAPGSNFNPAQPDSSGRPLDPFFSRQQFGAAVGFPITKDKTFLYLNYEGLRQDADNCDTAFHQHLNLPAQQCQLDERRRPGLHHFGSVEPGRDPGAVPDRTAGAARGGLLFNSEQHLDDQAGVVAVEQLPREPIHEQQRGVSDSHHLRFRIRPAGPRFQQCRPGASAL